MKSAIQTVTSGRTLGMLTAILACVGVAAPSDSVPGAVLWMLAASGLVLAACACVLTALRGGSDVSF